MNTRNDPYGDPRRDTRDDPTGDPYREWDSAYVLGALPVDERLAYERHLETCDACSRAVRDLAGIPGILGKLDTGDALAIGDRTDAGAGADAGAGEASSGVPSGNASPGVPPGNALSGVPSRNASPGEASPHGPPSPRNPDGPDGPDGSDDPVPPVRAVPDGERVLRVLAGRERAGRRRRVLAFAASCALFAALGAGAATLGGGEAAVHTRPGPSQSPDTGSRTGGGVAAAVAMKPVGSSELHAALSVTGKPWGTRLEWSCRYKGGHGKGHGEGSGDGHEDRGPAWDDGRAPKPAYELVVTDTSGKRSVVATWKGAGDAAEHLTASSKSTPQQIRSVGIRLSGSHRTLAEGTP